VSFSEQVAKITIRIDLTPGLLIASRARREWGSIGLGRIGRATRIFAVHQSDLGNRNHVPLPKNMLLDCPPIDLGPGGRAEVKQYKPPVANAQLGMCARDVVAASVHDEEGTIGQRARAKYFFALHGVCEFKWVPAVPCDHSNFPTLQGRIGSDGDVRLTLKDVAGRAYGLEQALGQHRVNVGSRIEQKVGIVGVERQGILVGGIAVSLLILFADFLHSMGKLPGHYCRRDLRSEQPGQGPFHEKFKLFFKSCELILHRRGL